MGYILPKIPIFNSITTIPEEKKIHVKRPQYDIELPPWVEVPEDCYVASCRMQDYRNSHAAVVVFYKKPGSFEWGRGYAKVYVYDDNNANLFPQMKGIIREMRKRKLNFGSQAYDISEEGEIREYMTRDIPSEDTVRNVAMSMMELRERWRGYPNIDNFETVEKLEKAKKAIRKMHAEETYGRAKGRIDTIRNSIKEEQRQIAQIESDLNDMYEKAANAMNFLEQNGIDPNHFDELEEPMCATKGKLAPCPLKFVGMATITRTFNGLVVAPENLKEEEEKPKSGDMVLDPATGDSAICDGHGNWQLVCP
jgi:hypothetical protein